MLGTGGVGRRGETAMTYPGNPALAPEVQERLLSTFEQSLGLAETGKRQEALLGCDFILGLDPQFSLAKTLRERLTAAAGPIGVDDLRQALEPVPDWGTTDRLLGDDDSVGAGAVDFGELPPLDDGFGDLPSLETSFSDLAAAPASRAPSGLQQEIAALVARRELSSALELAARNQMAVMADSELQRLVQSAQELVEAEPFVRQFLSAAQEAQARGDAAEAARLADKIAALDPGHPALADLPAAPAAAPAREPELEADLGGLPSFDLAAVEPPEAPVDLFAEPPPPSLPSVLATQPVTPALADAGGGDPRIRELLGEGQAAYDRGDYQAAIDAWSRIFLIDIDSEEASDRIEQARRMKAEVERRVEEAFQVAVGHLEKGAYDEASQALRRVLELQPGHLAAKDYLAQLEAGIKPAPPKRSDSGVSSSQAAGELLSGGVEELKEEILVPPEPGQERKRAAAAAGPILVAKGGRTARRNLILASVLGVAGLGAGGWYLYTHRAELFPNADDAPAVTANPELADPLLRARKLHEEGKTAVALAQLKRMPPEAPQFAEAQKLIAAWEAELAPPPPAPEETEEAKRLRQALELARTAHADGDFVRSRQLFERLAAIAPLPAEDAARLTEAKQLLEPFAAELALIEQGETERALPALWRRLDESPSDRVARRIVATAYYNLGVSDLQRGDPKAAAEKLSEAFELQPDDEALARHLRFAQTYSERGQDLLYRTYVKYLVAR
jgi:tetratricopeptide (TPR) repeat protein